LTRSSCEDGKGAGSGRRLRTAAADVRGPLPRRDEHTCESLDRRYLRRTIFLWYAAAGVVSLQK
jgi:hypothetical protein